MDVLCKLQGEKLYLDESFSKGRVFICEQSASNIRVGHLQKSELRIQCQTNAFLRQKRPVTHQTSLYLRLHFENLKIN